MATLVEAALVPKAKPTAAREALQLPQELASSHRPIAVMTEAENRRWTLRSTNGLIP